MTSAHSAMVFQFLLKINTLRLLVILMTIHAHLIAAAPKMYKMLEQLSSELRHAIGEVNDMRKAKICGSDLTPPDLWDAESCYLADKLLAKARGEQDA